MLITAEFPVPGSMAVWHGAPVRIHQWNNDGTFLILGEGRCRRVDPEELAPYEQEALDQWIAARVAMRGDRCFTSTGDLYEDYRLWSDIFGIADFRIYSRLTFGAALAARGFKSAQRTLGLFRTIRQSGFALTLRPLDGETA